MRYAPAVESLNQIGGAPFGPGRTVLFFDQIKSSGPIQYALLLGVFDNASESPLYFVTSEVNAANSAHGGGSHFLGVFNGEAHANHGASDDWADPEKFFPEALKLAAADFGITPAQALEGGESGEAP